MIECFLIFKKFMQKWPNTITLIRHGESKYNAVEKESIPDLRR